MGLLSHLFYPWGLILQGLADHPFHPAPARHLLDLRHPVSRPHRRTRLSRSPKPFPTSASLATPSRGSPAANASDNFKSRFATTHPQETTKSWATSTLRKNKLQPARDAYDKAVAARPSTIDPFYGRGLCAILLGDAAAAMPDLEQVVAKDPGHDFHRAAGLLAQPMH